MTSASEGSEVADEILKAAWIAGDRFENGGSLPKIGIFGLGVPEGLLAAAGGACIHVNFGASPDHEPMRDVIEPFVDHEVRVFLNRFALGAFNGMAGIVFARDDAAALTAYQYATEWVRQGLALPGTPPLFLFNLVHSQTEASLRFNRIQCDKLINFLVGVGLSRPDNKLWFSVSAQAKRRADLLDTVFADMSARIAAEWRNAGRFMTAERHAGLLEQAVAKGGHADKTGPGLALVGSPMDDPSVYALLDRVGVLAADLQAYGQFWPGAWEQADNVEAMLLGLSGDPSCPRIVPPKEHRQLLLDRIIAAGCDLVVCQLAQTDDTFGWDVPGLKAALEANGIGFINLGFRDYRPGGQWLAEAERQLTETLGRAS